MLKNFEKHRIERSTERELTNYINWLEERVNDGSCDEYMFECLEYAYEWQKVGNFQPEKESKLTDQDIKNIKASVVEYRKSQRIEKLV